MIEKLLSNFFGGLIIQALMEGPLYALHVTNTLYPLSIIGYATLSLSWSASIYLGIKESKNLKETLIPISTGIGTLFMAYIIHSK